MKIRKFNEEIGFSYSGKEGTTEKTEPTIEDIVPFSIDSIEKTYKKIAKEAFNAARKNDTLTFDEWWNKIWNIGSKVEKPIATRNRMGFDIKPVEISSKAEIVDRPRIKPPKPPNKPPRRITTPEPMKPGKRKGIWFDN